MLYSYCEYRSRAAAVIQFSESDHFDSVHISCPWRKASWSAVWLSIDCLLADSLDSWLSAYYMIWNIFQINWRSCNWLAAQFMLFRQGSGCHCWVSCPCLVTAKKTCQTAATWIYGSGQLVGTFVQPKRAYVCVVKNALWTVQDRKNWRKMGGGGDVEKYTWVGEKCKNAGENKYNHIKQALTSEKWEVRPCQKFRTDLWDQDMIQKDWSVI